MPASSLYLNLLKCQIDCDDILHGFNIFKVEFDLTGGKIVVNFLILVGRQIAELVVFELQTDAFIAGVVLNDLPAFEAVFGIIAENFLQGTADVVNCGGDNLI